MIPAGQPGDPAGQTPQTTSIQARFKGEYFSGPIPPPNLLERYNEVVSNGAERILAMAEKQSAHRESLETKVVDANLKSQRRGQTQAFIVALAVILGGIYIMAKGYSGWGFAAIITSLASLVAIFAIGKREQRNERVEKSNALDNRRGR